MQNYLQKPHCAYTKQAVFTITKVVGSDVLARLARKAGLSYIEFARYILRMLLWPVTHSRIIPPAKKHRGEIVVVKQSRAMKTTRSFL